MHITSAQKDVSKFASKSGLRADIRSVKFDGQKAVATDSFSLLEVVNEAREAGPAIMLEAKSLDKAKVKMPKTGGMELEKVANKGLYTLEGEGDTATVIMSTAGADEYPKYSQVIPTGEPVITIRFTAEYLANMAMFFKKHSNGGSVEVKLYGEYKPAVFTGKTKDDQKIMGLLMPRNG